MVTAQQQTIDKSRKTIVRRKNSAIKLLSTVNIRSSNSGGFTLIEILVAITILVTLIAGVMLALNPGSQISKAQDARRVTDIQAIKNALDLYYSDNKCYPRYDKGIPFGLPWKSADNSTIYMKTVPQDPQCSGGTGNCYTYQTDTTATCPQWNVVLSQLSQASNFTKACALTTLSTCMPPSYSSTNKYACAISGAVDCNILAGVPQPTGAPTTNPTSGVLPTGITPAVTVAPTAAPTAAPTGVPLPTPLAGSVTIDTLTNPSNNPFVVNATVIPYYQTLGNMQSINLKILDSVGNVNSVKVVVYSDGDPLEFPCDTQVYGNATNGVWCVGKWWVAKTYYRTYGYDIIVSDDKGNTQTGRYRANR